MLCLTTNFEQCNVRKSVRLPILNKAGVCPHMNGSGEGVTGWSLSVRPWAGPCVSGRGCPAQRTIYRSGSSPSPACTILLLVPTAEEGVFAAAVESLEAAVSSVKVMLIVPEEAPWVYVSLDELFKRVCFRQVTVCSSGTELRGEQVKYLRRILVKWQF